MHYTTRSWVANPGHEEDLLAYLRSLEEILKPLTVATYLGRDFTRPGVFVTFAVWQDRAAIDAFLQSPALAELAPTVGSHLDRDASPPGLHLEQIV